MLGGFKCKLTSLVYHDAATITTKTLEKETGAKRRKSWILDRDKEKCSNEEEQEQEVQEQEQEQEGDENTMEKCVESMDKYVQKNSHFFLQNFNFFKILELSKSLMKSKCALKP